MTDIESYLYKLDRKVTRNISIGLVALAALEFAFGFVSKAVNLKEPIFGNDVTYGTIFALLLGLVAFYIYNHNRAFG